MRHRIVFDEDLMMVMDAENNGYDCHVVNQAGEADAERKIDEWAGKYKFDAARAKRELRKYVRQL